MAQRDCLPVGKKMDQDSSRSTGPWRGGQVACWLAVAGVVFALSGGEEVAAQSAAAKSKGSGKQERIASAPAGANQEGAESAPSSKSANRAARRLPPYYGEVVSAEQREKIYQLQTQYTEQVRQLRERLDSLEVEHKKSLESLLTAEQREQVARLIEQAKSKRARKEAKEPATGTTGAGSTE